MMAGANPAAVQRILRHSDPRLTTEVYGHLAPDYLRREIDLLSFSKTVNGTKIAFVPDRKTNRRGPLVVQEPVDAALAGSEGSQETPRNADDFASAPRGNRTPNPRLRRPMLYPIELWAQSELTRLVSSRARR